MLRLPPRVTLALAMVALPLSAVGFLATRVTAQLARPTPQIAEGPAEWVAFQAVVRVSHPGQPLIHGRFYRSSTGSQRLETGPSLSDIRVVSIRNVPQRLRYEGQPKVDRWVRSPIAASVGAKPPTVYVTGAWSVHPYRLALMKGQSGALDAAEGFKAYSIRLNSGGMESRS